MPVHLTASVFIVDAAGGRMLLVWHPKFGRWLSRAATATARRRWARSRCARFGRKPASSYS
jgi:hypothetical protein